MLYSGLSGRDERDAHGLERLSNPQEVCDSMKHPRRHPASGLAVSALLGALACLVARPAHAYIDPASGSYLFQLLIGGVLAGLFTIASAWRNVLAWLRGEKPPQEAPPPETNSGGAAAAGAPPAGVDATPAPPATTSQAQATPPAPNQDAPKPPGA